MLGGWQMRKTFIRSLVISAALQFAVTRARAGRVQEEGAAETLWMLYPFNVLLNALMWTLLISTFGGFVRLLKPSS
jgi:hypothetical protein